jgi:rfaE bifunctional protein nucleotidyltransferase chain/domain
MSAVIYDSFMEVPHVDGTVLTNGCFDVLHVGHIRLLERAAMFGRRLVVAVNADHSVTMLKGNGRPINKLKDRMEMLASLDCVDVVTGFPDNNVVSVIGRVLPHCWVKGGDYTLSSLNQLEVQAANDIGTVIVILKQFGGYSTTATLDKVQKILFG